jgi:uncharacterized protein (DUF1800 family)
MEKITNMLAQLSSRQWNFDTAAHLLVRAGFGGPPAEIERLRAMGLDQAVDAFVDAFQDSVSPPQWANPHSEDELLKQVKEAPGQPEKQAARKALNEKNNYEMKDLTLWWIRRMVKTPSPFVEKMTLFWHGHFATSGEKVRPAFKMWLQNQTFRAYALSDFGSMAKAVSRDPAMLIWLDTVQSKRGAPNENFSREVMELFTLGEGHYSETDVKEAARAFTGYRIDQPSQSFKFMSGQFDATPKTFMGVTGAWDGDQIIDLILDSPHCARFIASKIWRFFAYDDPTAALIEALGSELRNVHYQMRPFMKLVFASSEFYGAQSRNTQIKSPVQFVVQAFRTLPIEMPGADILQYAFRQMGQIPFYPPNVKGWDGGKSWINTGTLAFRYKLARQLVEGLRPEELGMGKRQMMEDGSEPPTLTTPLSVDQIISQNDRQQPEKLVQHLVQRTFQGSTAPKLSETFTQYVAQKDKPFDDETIRDLLVLMMTTPTYQIT